jgi:hypothetical protein
LVSWIGTRSLSPNDRAESEPSPLWDRLGRVHKKRKKAASLELGARRRGRLRRCRREATKALKKEGARMSGAPPLPILDVVRETDNLARR